MRRTGLAVLIILMAAMIAWVATRPVRYPGRVLMEVSRPAKAEGAAAEPAAGWTPLPPGDAVVWVRQQAESRPVLERVVRELDLARRWRESSPEAVMEELRSRIRVEGESGTSLVKVEVVDSDVKLVAPLANKVVDAVRQIAEAEARMSGGEPPSVGGNSASSGIRFTIHEFATTPPVYSDVRRTRLIESAVIVLALALTWLLWRELRGGVGSREGPSRGG